MEQSKNRIILTQKDFTKLKEEIKKLNNNQNCIIFSSKDDDLNRKVLEKLKIDILLIHLSDRKDYQKQRNSGFNQVMSKIAKDKNISIGINLDEIIEERNLKEKSTLISRLKQNIRLCNKYKIKMRFISQKKINQRNSKDLKALGLILGMPTWMAKEI